MKKPYEFLRDTNKYAKGQVVDFSPNHIHTRQRLERGIIKPVAPAKTRQKKVIEPEETKDEGQND